jgi:hypothetical protein
MEGEHRYKKQDLLSCCLILWEIFIMFVGEYFIQIYKLFTAPGPALYVCLLYKLYIVSASEEFFSRVVDPDWIRIP